ncbi:MAG: RNA polymerase factor sigma-54, partial [Candidatus Cloacimonetes bacterium]|nr:RNA polymerase factor sigma-54 [Candidatus Cloacimonadota bacterium]
KENRFEQFIEQLAYLGLNEIEDEFAGDMIESCNEYGFLPEDYIIKQVAKEYGISVNRAEEIHTMIMDMYPKGITARNIVECLLAQLKDSYDEDSIIYRIVKDDFDNLIHKRYFKIAPKYQVSQDYVIKIRDIIAGLDPKPGLRISEVSEDYITPDVIIKLVDDDFEVIINDFYSPNLSINPHYKQMISTKLYDKDTVKYVREKINSARFLIKSIYMRRRTMERVVRAIIKHQYDFFFNPERILHPMTYSVIAEDLGISESTVSRVVKDKYADTPFGIIPLKNFFSPTAGQDTNFESISRQKVKNCIMNYIEDEDPDTPISDQDIVEKLREDNMFVSRRIVAKYRDEMGILNSRLRRRS